MIWAFVKHDNLIFVRNIQIVLNIRFEGIRRAKMKQILTLINTLFSIIFNFFFKENQVQFHD
jgi:hypothetical protein